MVGEEDDMSAPLLLAYIQPWLKDATPVPPLPTASGVSRMRLVAEAPPVNNWRADHVLEKAVSRESVPAEVMVPPDKPDPADTLRTDPLPPPPPPRDDVVMGLTEIMGLFGGPEIVTLLPACIPFTTFEAKTRPPCKSTSEPDVVIPPLAVSAP